MTAAGPIPDYPSITQKQVDEWVKDGLTHISQIEDGSVSAFGEIEKYGLPWFVVDKAGNNLYTGSHWLESQRDLREYASK